MLFMLTRICFVFIQVLGPLLMVLLQGSLKLRLAAARLCEKLLPQAPLEMVQVLSSRAVLAVKSANIAYLRKTYNFFL